jgi:hypothetical protein
MHMQKGIATLSAAEQLYGETSCMERVVHGDMHGDQEAGTDWDDTSGHSSIGQYF